MDESDPLWQATLRVAQGDRAAALKMLDDPDVLMQYPEIRDVMMSSGDAGYGADGNWEDTLVPNLEQKATICEAGTATAPVHLSVATTAVEGGAKSAPVSEPVQAGAEEADDDDDNEGGKAVDTAYADEDEREHMNLVFIGHVDAGKSTLAGSILYLMGKVDSRTIERFEREAKQRNRESWFLAFIMDTSEEERAKGKTVEVGRAHFETATRRYTILDAPGHKNYVPNMISGAAQADIGVMVISARKGEFETGFEKGGQTREHAMLARTIGVDHLVVVINKMDDPTVEWDKERFEECVSKLKPYLKQCGYVIKKDIKFVPISGLSGDNVLKEVDSTKCPWWKEMYTSGAHNTFTPTLMATLDSLEPSNRDAHGPLRVTCIDRYFERGTVVLGKVESGTLRVGEEVGIMPTRKKIKVEEILIDEQRVKSARPGENVLIKLNTGVEDIQKGYVLCLPSKPCPAVVEIKAQLALVDMLETRPLFTPGYEAVMHVHTVEIEVTCVELIAVIEKGKAVPNRPFARTGQQCIVKLKMPLLTCMEPFDKMPALGRLTLRDEGKTIAIGKVMGLYKPPSAK